MKGIADRFSPLNQLKKTTIKVCIQNSQWNTEIVSEHKDRIKCMIKRGY